MSINIKKKFIRLFKNLEDTPSNYTDDADKLVKVNDAEDGLDFSELRSDAALQQLSTGLISGGQITANAGNPTTQFDVAAGSGWIVDSFTDPDNPTVTKVTWNTQTGISPTYLGTESYSEEVTI